MSKNCPNCGAPFDPDLIKCPYCGTTYLDFSTLNIRDRKPIYIKAIIPEGTCLFKAVPNVANMEMSYDTTDVIWNGIVAKQLLTKKRGIFDIQFDLVENENGELLRIITEE